METQKVRPLGSNAEVHFDCRIISAMNNNPLTAIEKREMRRDLFYRVSGNIIKLPPLSERRNDILLLANRFLISFAMINGKNLKIIDEKVVQLFYDYTWPGNIRELKNVIEHCVNTAKYEEEKLTLKHLPYYLSFDTKLQKDSLFYENLMNINYKEAKKVLMQQFEKDYIKNTIKNNNGNISATARKLGISRQSLYQTLKKLNINIDTV